MKAKWLSPLLLGVVLCACNALFGVEPGELAAAGGTSGPGGGAGTGGAGTGGGSGAGGSAPCDPQSPGPHTGALVWASASTASTYAMALGAAPGQSGDIVVAGVYSEGSIQLGADSTAHAGDSEYDVFLASYDAESGEPRWGKGFPAPLEQSIRDVAVDSASGDILVAGSFRGPFSLDGGGSTLATHGENDAFVARFGPAGEPRWSRGFGNPEDQSAVAIAATPTGGAVALLIGNGPIDLGDAVRGSEGVEGIHIVKMSPSGTTEWSRYYQTSFYLGPYAGVAVDAAGNIAVTGTANGPSFNSPDPFHGDTDVFVLKLDPDGVYLWSRLFGGTAPDSQNGFQWGTALAFDCTGDVLVTGAFQKDLRMGDLGVLTAIDDAEEQGDIFVAKLRASDGEPVWAEGHGDSGFQAGFAIDTDAHANVVVSGLLYDSPGSTGIDLGGGVKLPPSPSDGGDYRQDLFVAKYDAAGQHLWSHRFGDAFIQEGEAVVLPSGRVAVAGDFFFGIRLDDTPEGELTDDERDMFVASFDP